MDCKYFNIFNVGFLCIAVLCVLSYLNFSGNLNIQNRQLVLWGNTFVGLAPSYNVKYGCKFNDRNICCGLLTPEERAMPPLSPQLSNLRSLTTGTTEQNACKIKRTYVPSKYEDEHIARAEGISRLQDINARRTAVVDYFRTDIPAANLWLARVNLHMKSEVTPPTTQADLDYLSRFEVTKTCTGESRHLSSSWVEWIEPLTMHARHPFAYTACQNTFYTPEDKRRMKFRATVQSLDYLLIKSGAELHAETALTAHNHTQFEAHHNWQAEHRQQHQPTRNFMVDAGTSTFESSMIWFLCAYLQRKIAFDQEYGFEHTLLEPQDFWSRVPTSVKPYYHFFNAPVSAGLEDQVAPLRFIREIASPEDFVSFKLDIDTPSIEIPIAMEILRNPKIAALVDEFFFELHFRCELMMLCGWGDNIPEEDHGLVLNRYHAMKFFRDLREQGIRAHIWP